MSDLARYNAQFGSNALSSLPVSSSNAILGYKPPELAFTDVIPGQDGGSVRRDVMTEAEQFTEQNFMEYVGLLTVEEQEELQEALFVDGYYGSISSIDELQDTNEFVKALGFAARDAANETRWGLSEGFEGIPTLEERFSGEITAESMDAALDKYLKEEKDPVRMVMPVTQVDRLVESSWGSVLGRKATESERRAAFSLVRAAQLEAYEAQQSGGVVEAFDATGILEGQAEAADPMQAKAISTSNTTSAIWKALGLG
tara:strand:+ start:446 stop:1216 length:771 start_codon:yes stop_codon:yes gene_type:complete